MRRDVAIPDDIDARQLLFTVAMRAEWPRRRLASGPRQQQEISDGSRPGDKIC
ncbi:hypothetical protein [Streptomyces sp. NPDC003032]